MKRFLVLLGVAAAMVVSCSIEEESPVATTTDGSCLTLSGEMYTATKVSIGEKDGEVYPLLWYEGDAISIYSTDGTWDGEKASLDSEWVGQKSGVFHTNKSLEAETDMDLVIIYPGDSLTYADGVISGTLTSKQTQAEGSSSTHVGNNCLAYDEISIEAEQTEGITFALSQKTAFGKVTFDLGSGYSDYYLSGITLTAEGFNLAGSVSYDIEKKEMTVEDGSDTIEVALTNKALLSENPAVYFAVLPCDLTDTEVTIVLSLTDANNNEVTVPIQRAGGKFTESCLSLIKINDDGTEEWYDPIETRDLLDGWAYGKQNTYLVEQYATESNSITIDVKARGDISMVKEPKYYNLLIGSANQTDLSLCYLPDGTTDSMAEVGEDYTVTVNIYSQAEGEGKWAIVGLYDEDENIIWSFMIWKYLTGDYPRDVQYRNDVKLMDRNIGAPYGVDTALEKGTFGAPHAYFQWGRKDAFAWTASPSSLYVTKAASEGDDISTAIANPTTFYNNSRDWRNGREDLWGGVNNTTSWTDSNGIGHKTIYDPCPAGYRTMDNRVANQVYNNASDGNANTWYWEYDIGNNNQIESHINPDSPFYAAEESVLVHTLADGSYDYWPYAGQLHGTSTSYSNGTTTCINRGATYASNSINMNPSETGCAGIRYTYMSGATGDYQASHTIGLHVGGTIRCQKDDENR